MEESLKIKGNISGPRKNKNYDLCRCEETSEHRAIHLEFNRGKKNKKNIKKNINKNKKNKNKKNVKWLTFINLIKD